LPSTVDPPYRPVIGRRRFLLTSLAGALAAPLSGDAQETRGVHHIGVLSATTPTIPIVMVAVGDPLQTGLVSNLARPGGNLTGSSALAVELTPKRLELIRQLLPTAKRVALLWNPENPSNAQLRNELVRAAATAGVTLLSVGARRASEFDTAFTTLTRERPDALIVTADPLHQVHIGRVIGFAARSRLPAVYNLKANVEAGGLISYAASPADLFRRAAIYVARILNGAKPGDLPVEQPTTFELVINAKTARALGLTIPPSLLARADQVIE
jgi:putative tryptophan/tyrosine transport system substrate-binding protein